MKISYQWLTDYVAVTVDAEKLAQRLTMAGLEVEKTEKIGNDTVFELEITPNRPDCLNHLGIAREVSAIFNKPLKSPKFKTPKSPKKKSDIAISDKKDCSRYIGTVIENIRVQETPVWMKGRLSTIGLRSINNVVDISNFVLMEVGQPLHAFDYDKLNGKKIVVRRAKDGEIITTIDGVERKLNSSILVIADAKKPVAIAGIMGGKNTEVTESTKNILLESACFDPILIRRAARALGLSSDSSYRFERGVDMEGVGTGSARAVNLILELAGGTISAAADIHSQKTVTKRMVAVDKNEIDRCLGTTISLSRCQTILNKLGFKVTTKKNTLMISVPPFRNDIKNDVDIIEEVARILGYDTLPMSLSLIKANSIPQSKNRILRETVANHLTAQGFNEVISYTMTNERSVEKSNLSAADAIRVKNPLTAEQEMMRPSLLPSLLPVVALNLNRGQRDLKFFETGKIYLASNTEEQEVLGIVLSGRRNQDWRESQKQESEFYDVKGIVKSLLDVLSGDKISFIPTEEKAFERGQAACALLNRNKVATFGVLAASVLSAWDIKQKNILYGEVNLSALYGARKPKIRFRALSEFPVITRDVSLAVKKDVTFEQIHALAVGVIPEFLTDVKFVEQYLGEKIPAGHHGMTLSFIYQSPSRTLREEEVNQRHETFLKNITEKFGATIR